MRRNVNKILSIALAASLMMSTLMTPQMAAYAKETTDIEAEITETVEETEDISEEITEESTDEATEDTTEAVSEETTEEVTEETTATEDVTEESTEDVTEDETEEDVIEEEYDNPDTVTASDTKYDPSAKLTPVKERGGNSYVSWAFAICAAAEANIQKNGYETTPDMSEYQLMYYNGKGTAYDSLNIAKDMYYISDSTSLYRARVEHPDKADTYLNYQIDFIMRRLAGWVGLVDESETPSMYSPNTVTELGTGMIDQKDKYYLAEYEKISCASSNKAAIKEAIVKYGAVVTSAYIQDPAEDTAYWYDDDDPKYASDRVSYYCSTTTQPNTEITLVGWDDEYYNYNQATKPSSTKKGAWLCKYSRGTGFSGDGYFWISYYDKSLTKTNNMAYGMSFVPSSTYDYNYHYDGGPCDYIGSAVTYEAAMFKVAGYDTQKLKSVGLTTFSDNVSCEIRVYKDVDTYPNKGTKVDGATTTVSNLKAGYHVIDLAEEVMLDPEQTYSIVVRYASPTTPVWDSVYKGTSSNISHYSIFKSGERGQTFYSDSTADEPSRTAEGWYDTYEKQTSESRIKALTVKSNDGGGTTVGVTGIELDETNIKLQLGTKKTLAATVLPSNATIKGVSWSSDNTSVASVTQAGQISANRKGTAHITCTSNYNSNITATCTVTVVNEVTSIVLNKSTATLDASISGDFVGLEATISPTTADNLDVEWTCDDPEIVRLGTPVDISSYKKAIDVYPVSDGTTTVKCTAKDGSAVYASCEITVTGTVKLVPVESITISPSTLALTAGEKGNLSATVLPADATDKTITWSSSNTSVATVSSSGAVTAVAEGEATIKATANDGSDVYGECKVTVKRAIIPVSSVKINNSTSASLTTYVGKRTKINVKVEPDNADDKTLKWTTSKSSVATVEEVDGVPYVVAKGSGSTTITVVPNTGSGRATYNVSVRVPAESVTLAPTNVLLNVGKTQTLQATILPSNAHILSQTKKLNWSSSDTSVATVDANGLVEAVGVGVATITASAADNQGAKGTCIVTVGNSVQGIELNKTSIECKVGEANTLSATISPADAQNKNVIWSSDKESVATVDEMGKVTAVGPGVATITCTAADGSGVTATCDIIVTQPVTAISIEPETKELIIGDTSTFSANVSPSNASNKSVTWSSENTSVATIDATTGAVRAVAEGTTTIKATAKDGSGIVGSATVTVKKPIVKATQVLFGDSDYPAIKSMVVGNSMQIEATVLPEDATDKTLIWESNDTTRAVVSQDGLVMALAAGNVTISATTTDGSNKVAKQRISISTPVIEASSVILNKNSMELVKGSKETLTATVKPDNATGKSVSWSSDNTSVATVNNGVVTAVGEGVATIKCKATGGGPDVYSTCIVTVKNPIIAVSSITLNKTTANIETGASLALTATVLPSDATNKDVIWTSSDNSKAIVSANGDVTALEAGTVTITCTSADDSTKKASCTLTITDPVVQVSSIAINPSTLTLDVDATTKLTASVTPADATDASFTWSSSNENIVSISNDGTVTAKAAGTATIYATANDGSGVKGTCTVTVKAKVISDVKVGSIVVNPTTKEININNTFTLSYEVNPSNATNKNVSIVSSNEEVATVSSSGVVTGKKAGTAIITVSALDGSGKNATCEVTVVKPVVNVTGVTFAETSKTITEGDTYDIVATVAPTDADNKSLTWKSDNEAVAVVSSTGKVTAIGAGTANITATSNDGTNKSASCKITVAAKIISVREVVLDKSEYAMAIGNNVTLTATVKPENATNQSVIWTSSNTNVATVNNGLVTAIAAGETTITCKSVDGNKVAACHITVESSDIKVSSITVNPTSITLTAGESSKLEITVLPTDATNREYTISSSDNNVVTVSNDGTIIAKNKGNANITIKAKDGSGSVAICKVTVNELVIPVEAVKLDRNIADIELGDTLQLNATVEPDKASNKKVVWSSSNDAVAYVSSSGLVTARKEGTATITCKSEANNAISATCTITVTKTEVIKLVEKIVISPSTVSIEEGLTTKVSATVLPVDAANPSVVWTPADQTIASIAQDGTITANATGTTTIKATAQDGSGVYGECTVTVTAKAAGDVKVSAITVTPTTKSLNINETFTLTYKVTPDNATNKTVKIESSNPEVASINTSTGVVTAKAAGVATITVSAQDGSGKNASCVVTVIKPVKKVTSVSFNTDTATVAPNDTYQIIATVLPTDADDTTLTWESDNEAVAFVSNGGLVTAIETGIANITATAKDGSGKVASCKIIVKNEGEPYPVEPEDILVNAITINKTSASVQEGSTVQLTATVAPDNATNKTVSWSSSATTIAKVDSTGKVTALKAGKATITVKANDGSGKSASCVVTVTAKPVVPAKIDIKGSTVTFAATMYTYTKVAVKPEPKVVCKNVVLKKGTDYTVAYSNNVNPGKATVTITGIGKYTGTAVGYFYIMPEKVSFTSVENTSSAIKLTWKKAVGANGYYIYRSDEGKAYKKIQSITGGSVETFSDKTALAVGKKYQYKIVAYNTAENVSADSAIKTIYRLKNVSISSAKNSAKSTVTVKWKKAASVTGYEIRYSTDKNFKSKKTAKITKASTVSKKLTKLKKGKKYYISIRSYKKVGGVKYYSDWSTAKKVTIKK